MDDFLNGIGIYSNFSYGGPMTRECINAMGALVSLLFLVVTYPIPLAVLKLCLLRNRIRFEELGLELS